MNKCNLFLTCIKNLLNIHPLENITSFQTSSTHTPRALILRTDEVKQMEDKWTESQYPIRPELSWDVFGFQLGALLFIFEFSEKLKAILRYRKCFNTCTALLILYFIQVMRKK